MICVLKENNINVSMLNEKYMYLQVLRSYSRARINAADFITLNPSHPATLVCSDTNTFIICLYLSSYISPTFDRQLLIKATVDRK